MAMPALMPLMAIIVLKCQFIQILNRHTIAQALGILLLLLCTAAIMKGANLEAALLWAPINSMSVVQKVGAQAGLLSEHEINHWLRKAPHWYHPERMHYLPRFAR
jgi:hypothetical protein